MNEYLLAIYLWGFLSAVAVAMPAGIVLFRSLVQAWERYRGRVAEHVASLTSTPTPVPSHPSWS
jgi:hypothetical protein